MRCPGVLLLYIDNLVNTSPKNECICCCFSFFSLCSVWAFLSDMDSLVPPFSCHVVSGLLDRGLDLHLFFPFDSGSPQPAIAS